MLDVIGTRIVRTTVQCTMVRTMEQLAPKLTEKLLLSDARAVQPTAEYLLVPSKKHPQIFKLPLQIKPTNKIFSSKNLIFTIVFHTIVITLLRQFKLLQTSYLMHIHA